MHELNESKHVLEEQLKDLSVPDFFFLGGSLKSIHPLMFGKTALNIHQMQEVQSASIQVGGGNQEHLNFDFGWCDCDPGAFVLRNHQYFLQPICIVIAIRIDKRLWFFFAAFSCCFWWFCDFGKITYNNFITIMTKEAVGYFEIHHAPAPGSQCLPVTQGFVQKCAD